MLHAWNLKHSSHDFCGNLYIEFEQGLRLHPQNTTAYVGTNVVLRCSAQHSVPIAKFMWTWNGQALDLVTDDRLHVMSSGNLYIISVNLWDGGVYQCVATNLVTLRQWRSSEALLSVLGEAWLWAIETLIVMKCRGSCEGSVCIAKGHCLSEYCNARLI